MAPELGGMPIVIRCSYSEARVQNVHYELLPPLRFVWAYFPLMTFDTLIS